MALRTFIIVTLLLSGIWGCTTGIRLSADELPIYPHFDEKIYSIDYYSKTKNYNCLQKIHSMRDEKSDFPADRAIRSKAKKIGENHYEIIADEIEGFEKQKCDYCCWASCLQYLMLHQLGKYKSQEKLIQEFKAQGLNNDPTLAATSGDMLKKIWSHGTTIIPGGGANAVLYSLSQNKPLMAGILADEQGEAGHAVIIIGARFSYAATADPPCWGCTRYAFTEFIILDPRDTESPPRKEISAAAWDNKISFTLFFHEKKN